MYIWVIDSAEDDDVIESRFPVSWGPNAKILKHAFLACSLQKKAENVRIKVIDSAEDDDIIESRFPVSWGPDTKILKCAFLACSLQKEADNV